MNDVLENWCSCGKCSLEQLVGALEYRYCQEVAGQGGKLSFDGSIAHIKCITDQKDYKAVVNKEVLLLAAPLLKKTRRKEPLIVFHVRKGPQKYFVGVIDLAFLRP